jgi:hypothetical protein
MRVYEPGARRRRVIVTVCRARFARSLLDRILVSSTRAILASTLYAVFFVLAPQASAGAVALAIKVLIVDAHPT